jgi:hypothetical protein
MLYEFFFSSVRATCSALLIHLYLIILIIFDEPYKLWGTSLCITKWNNNYACSLFHLSRELLLHMKYDLVKKHEVLGIIYEAYFPWNASICVLKLAGNNYIVLWNRVLPEDLIVAQLIKKFPSVCGIRTIITLPTITHHWFYPEVEECSPYSYTLNHSDNF